MSFETFPLKSVGLSPNQLASCSKVDIHTAQDLFLTSPQDLIKKLQLRPSANQTPQQISADLIKQVSKSILPNPQRLSAEVVKKDRDRWVRSGDVGIDEVLGGGVRRGVLTEIVGESAAGKSHLALTLALTAQLESLTPNPGGAVILTTERGIPVDRLFELAKSILAIHGGSNPPMTAKRLLDDIHTTRFSEIDHLINFLMYKLPAFLQSRNGCELDGVNSDDNHLPIETNVRRPKPMPIRMIILDSITSVLRGDSTSPTNTLSLTERSRHLCVIADQLKSLAAYYDIAVVVINQVSDVFSRARQPPPQLTEPSLPPSSSFNMSQFYSDGLEPPMLYATQSRWFSGQSRSLHKEASLGIVWANAVNTRIMVSRTGRRKMINERDLWEGWAKRRRLQQDGGTVHSEDVNDDDFNLIPDDPSPTLIRRFHLIFSPFSGPSMIDYIISSTGIHSIPDTLRIQDTTSEVKSRARRAKAILDKEREEYGDESLGSEDRERDEILREIERGKSGGDDSLIAGGLTGVEEGDDVYDDFGDLPAEFWEGKLGEGDDGDDSTAISVT